MMKTSPEVYTWDQVVLQGVWGLWIICACITELQHLQVQISPFPHEIMQKPSLLSAAKWVHIVKDQYFMQNRITLPWLALILRSLRIPVCVHSIQVNNFQQQINNVLLLFAIVFQQFFTFILQNLSFFYKCLFYSPKIGWSCLYMWRMIEQLQVFWQINKTFGNYISVMKDALNSGFINAEWKFHSSIYFSQIYFTSRWVKYFTFYC